MRREHRRGRLQLLSDKEEEGLVDGPWNPLDPQSTGKNVPGIVHSQQLYSGEGVSDRESMLWVTSSVFNTNILRGWEMVTFFAGYKLIVLTRMVWSACSLAMGIVIGKYRPTRSVKNMAICLVTFAVFLNGFYLFILTVVAELELF